MGRTGDELGALTRELGIKLAVGRGSTVTVRDLADGELRDYTFATDAAVDLKPGHVSMASPIAVALVGTRSVGEEVTAQLPDGDRRLVVLKVHARGSKNAHRLAAWSLAESLSETSPAAKAGAGDPPWVFAAHAKRVFRQVRRRPSRQLRPSRRRVVVDAPWALVAASSDVEVETLDGADPGVVDTLRQGSRRLYRTKGKVGLRAEDGSLTVVETRPSTGRQGVEYRLQGKQRIFGRAGTPVFVGRPALHKCQGEVLQGVVPEQEVEWAPEVPGAKWKPVHPPEAVVGGGLLRCTRAGVVQRSVRICVLPVSADVAIRPSSDARRGEIALTGFGEIDATVAGPSDVTAHVHSDARETRLGLIAHDHPPPRTVIVTVEWRGRTGPRGRAELMLPFPTEHAAFFDARGQELPVGCTITPKQMVGARAEVVVRAGAEVKLRGRYVGKDKGEGEVARRCAEIANRVPAVGPGRHVLDLAAARSTVADALAVSRDVDGAVELLVCDGRQAESANRASVRVARFDLRLVPSEAGSSVLELDAAGRRKSTVRDLASLAVEALNLLDPNLKSAPLSRVGDYGWRMPRERLASGAHLVVGRQGCHHRVRPLLWRSGPEGPCTEPAAEPRPRDVAEAYSSGFRDSAAAEAFRFVARQMGDRPDSADWRLVFGYLRETSLPVHVFPLLEALATTPKACAMAAVVANTQEDFDLLWQRMQAFRLAWRQVPLGCWRDAFAADAKRRRESTRALGDTDLARLALQDDVRSRIDRVKARLGNADEAIESMRAELTASVWAS